MAAKKKLIISGLTVAGFLTANQLPTMGKLAFAGPSTAPQKTEAPADATKGEAKAKKGSCSGGSCSAMKDTKKTDKKEGSCTAMKDKKEEKKGSCTAMKK